MVSKTLKDISDEIRKINDKNGWTYPKNAWENDLFIPNKIALMHSELSEALEAFRGSKIFTPITINQLNAFGKPLHHDGKYYANIDGIQAELGYMRKPTESEIQDLFFFELADEVIRVLDASTGLGIDLEYYIKEKLKKNAKRGWKHDGKRI